MTSLTLKTAKITEQANGLVIVNWMGSGSFTIGEQHFGNRDDALRFLRDRGIKLLG
jgi:hypothetical protein